MSQTALVSDRNPVEGSPEGGDLEAAEVLTRKVLLGVLGCAIEPRSAVYVSTPITTGRRFVEWRAGAGAGLDPDDPAYAYEHLLHVIQPNRAHIAPVVESLRQRFPRVIDPTAFEDVAGWEQHDYHGLWAGVIERFANQVVFAEGWTFSSGCVYELAAAIRAGIPLFEESGRPLAVDEALASARVAFGEVIDAGWEPGGLRAALADAESAAASVRQSD